MENKKHIQIIINIQHFIKHKKMKVTHGILSTLNSLETNGDLIVSQTKYNFNIESSCYTDNYYVIYSNKNNWIASRYVNCNYDTFAEFGLRYSKNFIDGKIMVFSSGDVRNECACLRPVVHLKSNVQITPSKKPKDTNTPHHITSY